MLHSTQVGEAPSAGAAFLQFNLVKGQNGAPERYREPEQVQGVSKNLPGFLEVKAVQLPERQGSLSARMEGHK